MQTLTGVVTSGRGEAGAFTQLPWLRAQFRAKFSFDPHPGTLNIQLDKRLTPGDLAALPWVAIDAQEPGYCVARASRVEINGRASAVWILPEVAGYPTDLVELMAGQSLRALLGLKDGDRVMIRVKEREA
jgi:CTP-dependent riboflavin kinase